MCSVDAIGSTRTGTIHAPVSDASQERDHVSEIFVPYLAHGSVRTVSVRRGTILSAISVARKTVVLKLHRRRLRLCGLDFSQNFTYITVCCHIMRTMFAPFFPIGTGDVFLGRT